ncbi:hypothetical protein FHS95_003495 [Sphingomonas naasensis]|uniref:DUF6916 domain-containing protein n=1 Tax=Sphingomonas naasensis TaxID=1344951 RepID=A0A4S1WIJ7_9SPHN|nr:hypothetical protein [Sphingomonas naasensis]NIJ21784.1 hypothetical protein [Sphingomonas naasensis]TGX42513.1 hypothetical protein E5A74_11800 [Sphingomonas naasensis]
MADSSRSSRRAFVLGGTAAACIAPLAVAQSRHEAGPAREGGAPAIGTRGEVAEWERQVGASFLIAGEAGKVVARLSAVVRPASDPKRPAELARFQPFTLWFETDTRAAPAGQLTYAVTHPSRETIDLFLSRGSDKGGKAMLQALFN